MLSLISILLSVILGNGKTFDAQLKNYLGSKLKSYDRYEYQVVQYPKSYSRIEINAEKDFRINKNYCYVPVEIFSVNNSVSSSVLTVKLKLYKNVFVSQKKIDKNQPLSRGMFYAKLMDVSALEGVVLENENELSAYRSRMIIREGAVLTKELIEPIPLINPGDKMVLHTGNLGVDVSMSVVSRHEGCVNDVIDVQAGGKIYKAKIIDQYNLRLEE